MSIWTNVEGYIEIPKSKHISLKEVINTWFDGGTINTLTTADIGMHTIEASWRYYIEFVYPQGNVESLEYLDKFLNSFDKIKYDLNTTVRMLN